MGRSTSQVTTKDKKRRQAWEDHTDTCRKIICLICRPSEEIIMQSKHLKALRAVQKQLAKHNLKMVVANMAGEVLFKIELDEKKLH